MEKLQQKFENLGYLFPSEEVLEDIYLFYKYYNNPLNKGISTILLIGESGSGKTYLSEVFQKFLGKNTEYFCIRCVEGKELQSIERTIEKVIHLANEGRKVVLTVEELKKSGEEIFSFFLEKGRLEKNNEVISLTEKGRKKLFVIITNRTEKGLSENFLGKYPIINLPVMPPKIVYKALLKKFEKIPHDDAFLVLTSKLYGILYANQDKEGIRLPSLHELEVVISSDHQLCQTQIEDIRRVHNLIRRLGKNIESKDFIKKILLDQMSFDFDGRTDFLEEKNSENYIRTKNADNLVQQYMEIKEEDPIRDIANILQSGKKELLFLDRKNREKIVELGVITHHDPQAIELLFDKIKFRGNPNSRFGFLNFEGENFIGVMKYNDTLVLIANKEYVSPRIFIRGLSTIIDIIYDTNQNIDWEALYFSGITAKHFNLTGLNVKILSAIPNFVLEKMSVQNGVYTYHDSNLKVMYEKRQNIRYLTYFQKYKAEPLFDTIVNLCQFNPELALPVSFVSASSIERRFVRYKMDFLIERKKWDHLKEEGWEVQVEDFEQIEFTPSSRNDYENYKEKDGYVFDWKVEKDEEHRKVHVYPKYQLKSGYLLYTSEEDWKQDETYQKMSTLEKGISLLAHNIYGNFVPKDFDKRRIECFSPLTMSVTSKLVDGDGIRKKTIESESDITGEKEFLDYYTSLSEATSKRKVLK